MNSVWDVIGWALKSNSEMALFYDFIVTREALPVGFGNFDRSVDLG